MRARGLASFYEGAYEVVAKTLSAGDSVGGSFEHFGRVELDLLKLEGVKPSDAVVDFGCGTGRLAVHLVPYLASGRYVGIDISRTMLREGARRTPKGGCKVEWSHQTTPRFDLPDASVDLMCAFSVFTHMEAEDTFRYLSDALRVVKPGGKLVLSCLPLSLAEARRIFLASAKLDLAQRWAEVRNVVTTEGMMDTLASMAGWKTLRWHRGDQPAGPGLSPLGQSVCVLERPC